MEKDSTGINPLPERPTWRRPDETIAHRNMLTPTAPLERAGIAKPDTNIPADINPLPIRQARRQNAVSVAGRNKQAAPASPKQAQGAVGVAEGTSAPRTTPTAEKARAQVTVVSDKLSDTPEVSDILSDTLAGVSPHAPDPPWRRRRVNKNSKGYKFSFRMPSEIKAKLEAKAAAAESYPSAYVLRLIAADLCLPINEKKSERSRGIQEQIAALTVALNKQGGLFNQIAAAINKGQPCPLERSEIDWLFKRHTEAINAIIKLDFD